MNDNEPHYKQVINYIRTEIVNGNLKQGDRMPSEKELGERFGLSRQTIRHATGELEEQGVITRVRGSGSYIGDIRDNPNRPRYMSVAVMLTYVDNYIFPPVVRGISNVLEGNGYSMQLSFTDNNVRKEGQILKNLIENDNVDAVIAEPSMSALPNPNLEYYEILKKRHIPVLFINASYPNLNFPCVRLDDRHVAYDAVQQLIRRGHRQIAGIFHCEDAQGTERYLGYEKALSQAGIVLEQKNVIWLDTTSIHKLEALMDYILTRIDGCTAVLAYNDEVACQLIKYGTRRGLKIPEELSIISIDDADTAKTISPKVTTYPHPKQELGMKAAENLLQMLENPLTDGNFLFVPEVKIRESVIDIRKENE